MSDFWDDFISSPMTASPSEEFLSPEDRLDKSGSSGLRDLTSYGKLSYDFGSGVPAGTRVAFADDMSALLSYTNPPEPGSEGTVVMVRAAGGDATTNDGRAFVKWDDGGFGAIRFEHLVRPGSANKKASSAFAMRFSNLGDLSLMFGASPEQSDDLVHKATKDLWSFRKDGEDYVIERLFDEGGGPLKV